MVVFDIPLDAKDYPVTKATVYSDRANVSRTISLGEEGQKHSLKIGVNDIKLSGVSECILPESIRVEGNARGVAILDVIHSTAYEENGDAASRTKKKAEISATLEKLEKQLQGLEDKQDSLSAKISGIEGDATWLNSYRENALNTSSNTLTGSSTSASVLDWLGDQAVKNLETFHKYHSGWRDANRDSLIELKRLVKENAREITALKANIEDILRNSELSYYSGQPTKRIETITIKLEASEIGPVALTVSYLVRNAFWSPDYDVRVFSEELNLKVMYRAQVWQSTGENWKDTELVLSTAKPATSGRAPEYERPWTLKIYENQQEQLMRAEMPMPQFKMARMHPPPPAALSYMMAAPTDAPRIMEYSSKATEGHISASFEIPTPTTIESDGEKHRVTVGIINLKASFLYATVPKLSANAFLKAKARNEGDYVFLPGPISVFLDENFVAKSEFKESISRNEEFELSLGVDEALKIKYPPISQKNESAGFISKQTVIRFGQDIVVHNTKSLPVQLKVVEQVPVSESERIQVNILEPANLTSGPGANTSSPELSEPWPEKRSTRLTSLNCVEWRLTLKPDEKQTLTLKYDVSHPSSDKITGLKA